jgi:hypothetical protein
MRKDMSKVIVERPRHGHSARHCRLGRPSELEGADGEPLRMRVRSGRLRKTKSLNENLAPLQRFLEAQVGRPWNKIYSEIAQHLKPTSTVQQHVRDHLGDLVALNARMVAPVSSGAMPRRVPIPGSARRSLKPRRLSEPNACASSRTSCSCTF